MAFNSYLFLFVFLPVVVAGYYLLGRVFTSQKPALAWLVAASLLFYASLGPGYLLVLVGSVLMNYVVVRAIQSRPEGSGARRLVLTAGIVANLLLLGFYKYTGFLADNVNALFGTDFASPTTTYPVGLSFYTFIQIGFLLDAYVGQLGRLTLLRYALFGTFFPYITAGPLVRHDEMSSQLESPIRSRTGVMAIAIGATMFGMGLFKKVVLADSVAPYVSTLFNAAAEGTALSVSSAWVGALAYTFELYFDFSGYSDMAIGLGFMLGLKLPVNFNSPLRATSLVDFWRRWHMTMVRFFTSHVYTPMTAGIMRRTIRRRLPEPVRLLLVLCVPVFVTFVLVGFWHGAGWGFIISGAIHGVALSVNLVWRELAARFSLPRIPGLVGWALMMVPLVASLVFLRAADAVSAVRVLAAMLGLGGAGATAGTFYGTATLLGFTYVPALAWTVLLAAIALGVPRNTQQIMERYDVALPTLASPAPPPREALRWKPNVRWAVAMAVVAGIGLVFVAGPSPFLYYRF